MQEFFKYQGAGNDFIIIDNRDLKFDASNVSFIKNLCDRRFGIGADGLMLLQNHNDFDFEMRYFNADGREGSMCGNGGRCIVAFAKDLGIFEGEKTDFLAVDGPHTAILTEISAIQADDETQNIRPLYTVKLQMIDVNTILNDGRAWVLDTGSPHYVEEITGLQDFALVEEAKKIRYGNRYGEKGINVNYVEPIGPDAYAIRTFERGVEDETYACGTGATAAALAMAHQQGKEGRLKIQMQAIGGLLTIHFNKSNTQFTEVFLEGPATFVFEGQFGLSRFYH